MGPPLAAAAAAAAARQITPELPSCLHTQQHPSAHLETGQRGPTETPPRLTPRPHPRVTPYLKRGVWLTNLCLLPANGKTPWVGRGIQLKKMCTPPVTQRKTGSQGEQPDSRSPRERKTRTWRLSSPSRSRMGAPPPPPRPLRGETSYPSPTWPHASTPTLWGREQVGASILRQQRSNSSSNSLWFVKN